ncbi:hypothetical protein ATCC90586_000302 [Pythium insidiosum]|nr:hypothetical protein ATCC90586_000302 [Pythium insidiosum]
MKITELLNAQPTTAVHKVDADGLAHKAPLSALLAAAAHVDVDVDVDVDAPPKGRRRRQRQRQRPLSDAEKRAKQRMLVKRSYYRKIDTLNALRATVQQLESDYNAVATRRRRSPQPPPPLPRHSISALVHGPSPEEQLRQSFADLAVSIDALRRENEALRALEMEQTKARTRIGILLNEELRDQRQRAGQYNAAVQDIKTLRRSSQRGSPTAAAAPGSLPSQWSSDDEQPLPCGPDASSRDDSPPSSSSSSSSPAGASRVEPMPSASAPPIEMTPMTERECLAVVRDAYTEIQRFRARSNYVTSGGQVFGWRDRRCVDGALVKFALEKVFLHHRAEDLARRTWRVLSTERGTNRIYSSSIRATFHLVQLVNEHNVVFYRTMERVGQPVVLKSLVLASFVETERGFLVLFRSIDPSARRVRDVAATSPRGRREIWTEMFSWGLFEPWGRDGRHCIDFFGGFVPSTIATSISFWMMEVLLIAVRCESECVGPLFILHKEDDKQRDDDGDERQEEREEMEDGDQHTARRQEQEQEQRQRVQRIDVTSE